MLVVAVVVAASASVSCAPEAAKHKGLDDPWFNEDSPPTITGNLDEAEARWRKDLEAERPKHADDPNALLTDDPPDSADAYGDVAFPKDTPPQQPKTFWDKFGNASFAVMTVLVTVGMAVAPYFLML